MSSNSVSDSAAATQLQQARTILKQAVARHQAYFRAARTRPASPADQATVRANLDQLSSTIAKLDQRIARVAVFGLVSRGKSAVLNALLGEKRLQTGPLNGVTLSPQTVTWKAVGDAPFTIELIDTPGLDEIDGQARAEMAHTIAGQADLILFVVSGDITRTEYHALCNLRQMQKPLLLVFNKIDLYPNQSRQAIYENLQQLAGHSIDGKPLQQLLSANEIVLVAAEPAPIQVRVEYPGGRVGYEWESPPPHIDALRQKILQVLHQEGETLMALNALVQTRAAETTLASKLMTLHEADAEALIWKFVRYKAIAVAVNPIAVLDVLGGTIADVAMIRALSNLYGLPITSHEARQLLKTIALSSGTLLLGEVGSSVVLGFGKSAAAAATSLDHATGFTAYAGTALAQAGLVGFSTYAVGRAIQTYLEQGCSWGSQGANTAIQEVLSQLDRNTIIFRLRQELSQQLGLPIT
jgi:hypothetical protein